MIRKWAKPRRDEASVQDILASLAHATITARDLATSVEASRDAELDRALIGTAERLAADQARALTALEPVADYVDAALKAMGPVAKHESVAEFLASLEQLQDALRAATPGRRKIGAPRVATPATRWFAAQLAVVLKRHGIRPTTHLEGALATTIEILWPSVTTAPLPKDLSRLLQHAVAP